MSPEPQRGADRGRPLFTALAVVQSIGFALLVGWLVWRAVG